MAIVEVSDLFLGHKPISDDTHKNLVTLSNYLRAEELYDVDMGDKLESIMESAGLKNIIKSEWEDLELSFQGPASSEVLNSWKQRFDRMTAFSKLLTRQHVKR